MINVLLDVVLGVFVAILVAAAMEPWSRLLHGRVWHRALYWIHRSHHSPGPGRLEWNDVLSVLHAPIASGLVIAGCQLHGPWRAILVGAGAGMTLFGLGYVLVHDGLVHGRIPLHFLLELRFLRRVRGAHLVHHRTGGPPYGLFLGPRELMELRRARSTRSASPTSSRAEDRAPS